MIMSYLFKLKSHPDILLKDHLESVAKLSKDMVCSKCIENKAISSEISYLIGVAHDFGKATTFFQEILINDNKRTKYANHGFLSSLFCYYLIKRHLKKSSQLNEFRYLPITSWIVVKKHHGNIKNVGDLNGEISELEDLSEKETIEGQMSDIIKNALNEITMMYGDLLDGFEIKEFIEIFKNSNKLNSFLKEIKLDAIKISRAEDLKYYFEILFFYSVLLDADKLSASKTSVPPRIDIPKDIVSSYKKIKFLENDSYINKVREEAYNEVNSHINDIDMKNERILSINLPTGIGKTLTGLSFALNLREKVKETYGFTPRIIYSLPFLSIIDQNNEVTEDVFRTTCGYREVPSNRCLKHHHLAEINYTEERDNELRPVEDINKSLLLTEGWHSEVIITTFVQFFHSLITNRNRAARKFHNIVNSIVLLDEIQSIPTEYWLLINGALNYLSNKFNCWIILMTATEPLIFEKDKEIKSLVENKDRYFKLFNRFELKSNLVEKSFDTFSKEVFDEIADKKDKDVMIVLNTIDSCKYLYGYIRDKVLIRYGVNDNDKKDLLDKDGICVLPDVELINLSTHILPEFRLNRINRIKDDNKRKIIITTQMVEAGVDISVDILYRDMAPLDSIIQSAGRCNRNNKRAGTVNVVLLKNDKTGKAYYSYIYDSVLIGATREVLQKYNQTVSESEFILDAEEKYYKLVTERKQKQESEQILSHLKQLNFGDIVEFNLIEERPNSVSLFVEINERAKSIRENIESILEEKDRFEKRKKLLKLKKGINQYSLSIDAKKFESINCLPIMNGINELKYIPKRDLDHWYKLDIGFHIDNATLHGIL